jgi:chloramphenicol-sensitive protein RarD
MHSNHSDNARNGVALALAAYILWGAFPVYFKAVSHVPPLEMLALRVVWSFALLALLALWRREWPAALRAVRTPRTLFILVLTTLFIATNWFTFIYAVSLGKVLQSSLGYFINPLVSVLCGYLFLSERLTRLQWISIGLAVVGVVIQTWLVGELPVLSLLMAFSFGLYGLLRKVVAVDSLVGLLIETALLAPLALIYLAVLHNSGEAAFLAGSLGMDVTLALSGVVTAAPLLLFGSAMKKLRLSTMGILQYIVPTSHFMLAVFVYGEDFSVAHLTSFIFIWAGLIVFSFSAFKAARARGA